MNNEMLPTLFSEYAAIEEQDVEEFRYEVLDPEDREFVQEKEYEVRTHWTRSASEIMASGEKLLLVQDRLKKANKGKNGRFEAWLRKVGLSHGNAFFAMKAYTKFGNNKKFASELFSPGSFKELTYASDAVVEQVITGEISPTKKAIREAEEARRKAEEAEKQAKKAEAKAKADAQAAQQQLLLKETSFQFEIDELTKQLEAKKLELENITTPEVEIREIEKEVIPTSVKNTIEELEKEVNKLNTSIKDEQGKVPDEVREQIKDLQVQIGTYKALADEKEKKIEEIRGYNARIADMNRKLSEEARLMSAETQASVGRARIRQKWRKDTTDLHVSIAKFVAEIPSMIDQESLEGDDWARQAQCVEILQRALSALGQMRNNQSDPFIDSSVDAGFAYTSTDIVDAEVVG